jgi:hypothetical protein
VGDAKARARLIVGGLLGASAGSNQVDGRLGVPCQLGQSVHRVPSNQIAGAVVLDQYGRAVRNAGGEDHPDGHAFGKAAFSGDAPGVGRQQRPGDAVERRLLGNLPHDGVARVFAPLDAATGKRPLARGTAHRARSG